MCRSQLRLVKALLPSLGRDVVVVAVDTDSTEGADLLRRYAEQEGFPWRHALATRPFLISIDQRFGTRALNPPSDPTLVIDTKGNPEIHFGQKDEQRFRELVAHARR